MSVERAVQVAAYPWRSTNLYVAELDAEGTVLHANPALSAAADSREGFPFSQLLTPEQRLAFSSWIAQADAQWRCATFGLRDARDGAAEDRAVWLRRISADRLELVAEPALGEQARLLDQVLQLNDDLISAQRALNRRQRELEAAREEAARSTSRIRQLEQILLAGLTPRDFDEALANLLRVARELLPGERVDILLLDETLDRLILRGSAGGGEAPPWAGGPIRIGEGLVGRIAATGVPVLIEDLAAARRPGVPARAGSLIGVPLRLEGTVIGVLALSATRPSSFSEAHLRLLELVGERVALAIGQAQLREREARMTETLQRSLLPQQLPSVPGVALAARYLAHTASVGGDFYDAIDLPGGRIGAAIGDVTGKGHRAAADMGRLSSALHAYALDDPHPLAVMNRLARVAERSGILATALYLVLDPATGEVELANAGHLPPLWLSPGPERGARLAQASYLTLGDEVSPMLGLRSAPRESVRFQLPVGSTLILYTDGLVERTHDIDEGQARLARTAAEGSEGTVEELCDHLLSRLAPSARFRDDVALLSIQRRRAG